jgi:hypothetical protein
MPSLSRPFMALLAMALVLAAPSAAFAAGGGGDKGTTTTVVMVLVVVGLAYLIANFIVDRLQRMLLIVTGFEYLILGVFLGPTVPAVHVLDNLSGMMPIIALAAGWVGLLRGMDLDSTRLAQRPPGTMRVVVLHHLFPGVLVGGAAYWFFYLSQGMGLVPEVGWREAGASAFVLACAAASDSEAPHEIVASRYEIDGPVARQIRIVGRISDVLVILSFGVAFCLFHVPWGQTSGTDPEWTMNWLGLQIALGLGLGALFTPFLGGNESPNGRFLALVGIITFASGAAYFVQLSPLSVNVLLGMVLVRFAKTGRLMRETLTTTEKPMNLVMLVLAGALWHPVTSRDEWTAVALVFGCFLLFRLGAKWLASKVAAWGMSSMRNDLYRGLLGQGEVTLAMAISFKVVYSGPVVDIAYTAILLSVVVMDLVAPRLLRDLLVDAGDVGRERSLDEALEEVEGTA